MGKISCVLKLGEVPLHLYQLIAGYLLLEKQGIIDLNIIKLNKGSSDILPYNFMEVIINGSTRVLYDANDGYDNLLTDESHYTQFMDPLAEKTDYYFKRSFSTKYNSKLKNRYKVYPLGLNYMVTMKGNPAHFFMKMDPAKEKIKKMVRMLPFTEYSNRKYYIETFESAPKLPDNPSILFMARLWDPRGDFPGQISKTKQEEREHINSVRVKCIRLCKKEFGHQFFGGITPSSYAIKNFKDIVIEDKMIARRDLYLKRVKESSICVATMGLHQSIGWKFSEYVAASKAIVTEELHYEVPGEFSEGKNYLTFKNPEQCATNIYKLLNNPQLIDNLMINNYAYYQNNVRPDRLILNTILTVLSNGKEDQPSAAFPDSFYAHL